MPTTTLEQAVLNLTTIPAERNTELDKYFSEYINEAQYTARLRPATLRGYKAVFKLFLEVMPEVNGIASLTTEVLNEFFKRIETRLRKVGKVIKSGVKKSTIKTQWTKLNVFFSWLCMKGHLSKNPLTDIKPPQVSYEDYKRLEDNELQKIYSAISIYSNSPLMIRRDIVITSLLLFCGLRKTELLSLQLRDVDLIKNEITIRGETSKSKRTRVLPLNPILVLHLKDYFKERTSLGLKIETLIVTTKKDAGLTEHGLKHWVNSLIQKSGVKFHLHQFRHTFACKLSEANVNVFKIQKLMGHTDVKMTMRYTRSLQTEDMGEDIGKISF